MSMRRKVGKALINVQAAIESVGRRVPKGFTKWSADELLIALRTSRTGLVKAMELYDRYDEAESGNGHERARERQVQA